MEAMFKAFAKALDMAVGMDSRITDVLSTERKFIIAEENCGTYVSEKREKQ